MKKTIYILQVSIILLFCFPAVNTCLWAGEIHDAVWAGDLNKVRALLEADSTLLEAKDNDGNTPLIVACKTPQVAVANFLIDKGANVNARNNRPFTSLQFASYWASQDLALIKRLIDKGADVNSQGENGMTPLHWAALKGDIKVARLLLENGANVNPYDKYSGIIKSSFVSGTVLEVAIKYSPNEEMAKLFVENGAKINLKDDFGNTELHMAAMKGYTGLTSLLIKYGADVNAMNEFNHTALYYAAKHGYRSIADVLIDAGANKSTIVEFNFGKAPQLAEALREGEAYLWNMGGYALKTKGNLLIFNPSGISESPEAGLANGHINPNEISDQKITILITEPQSRQYGTEIFTLAKRIQGVYFVINYIPTDGSTKNLDTSSYRLATPHESFSLEGIKVHTIPTMGDGLGYLVEVDGMKIFHAGFHVGDNNASNVVKFREEIDFLKPFGPIDIAILNVLNHARRIEPAYEPYLYLIDQLKPKVVYLLGANIPEQYTKCVEVLRARNIPVAYPEGGLAEGELFHYLQK